ncbi:uncharacterized protein LODBEIA_P56350 [Lodderomyces beijingensis]|uniref:rRNA-processing protein FYV7 n=1 Tax=Lodderomyces beijingensis TaxID=1775926 RepID=A0ABP0ZTF1_9ASCO
MAPPAHSKPNRKRFTDRKETKTADIKRALTHRARLRKNYFKLLKNEGLEEHQRQEEGKDGDGSSDGNEDDGEEESDGTSLARVKSKSRSEKPNKAQPFNYAERAALAKQRKAEQRQAKLATVQERIKNIEKQRQIRELKKSQLKQKTKYGQPVMGPRINNLLEKIKKDNQ